MIYTAESRALGMAELAVHLTFATLPSDFLMIEIEISVSIKISEVALKNLNEEWSSHPPSIATQKISDNFINSAESCLLKVPSAVVKGDFNFLINPYHEDFKRIKIVKITDFPFDRGVFE